MRIFGTDALEQNWDRIVELECRHYGKPYGEYRDNILGNWLPSGFYFCNFAEDDSGNIRSLLSFAVFAKETWESLYTDSSLSPKSLSAYQAKQVGFQKPVIYLASMIIGERIDSPYLFKSISRELAAAQDNYRVHFNEIVSIGVNKRSGFLLKRYGFEKVGTCKGLYDVQSTTRERCPIFNAVLS